MTMAIMVNIKIIINFIRTSSKMLQEFANQSGFDSDGLTVVNGAHAIPQDRVSSIRVFKAHNYHIEASYMSIRMGDRTEVYSNSMGIMWIKDLSSLKDWQSTTNLLRCYHIFYIP